MSSKHWTPKDDSAWYGRRNIETPNLAWYLNYHDLSAWQRSQSLEAEASRLRGFKAGRTVIDRVNQTMQAGWVWLVHVGLRLVQRRSMESIQ